jgi:hypothetical protein
MIEWNTRSADDWLKEIAELATPQGQHDVSGRPVEDWATESLLAAWEADENPLTGTRIKPGAKLGRDFFGKSLPVVRQRLYQAGVTLAFELNECFGE